MGSESRTLVPPNRTNRSSPGSSIGASHSSGALSDASAGIAHVARGLLRSEKNGLLAFPWGVFGRQHAAVWGCRLVAECDLVQGRGIRENPLRQCLPSGDCDFSCTQIGDNSGCVDARSLALPRYCLDVGRSAKAETYVNDPAIGLRGIFDRWGSAYMG